MERATSSNRPGVATGPNGLVQIERPAIRTDLVCQRLDGELLVFDKRRMSAHRLNSTAVKVWDLFDGTRTLSAAADELTRAGVEDAASVVEAALAQFAGEGLLQGCRAPKLTRREADRRQFMRWGAIVAGASMPLVISMLAPSAAHAVTCIPFSGPCNPNGPNICCQDGVNNDYRCCQDTSGKFKCHRDHVCRSTSTQRQPAPTVPPTAAPQQSTPAPSAVPLPTQRPDTSPLPSPPVGPSNSGGTIPSLPPLTR